MTDIDSDDVRFKKMRPLISYYGGKQRMASKIVPLLPEHSVYVEPFAGGAAVLFAKPWPSTKNSDHYREVINDINNDLVNMYRVARDHPNYLSRALKLTTYGREEFKSSVRVLRDNNSNEKLRAWATYVKYNQSFSKLGRAWGTSVCSENHAATWNSKNVNDCLMRLRAIHIECDDVLEIIQRWDSPQTLFYCDPPYIDTDCDHYRGYTLDAYKSLITFLSRCVGSVVLSCYENNKIKIPEEWEKFTFKSSCSASSSGKIGNGRDKSKRSPARLLGNRNREEVVYRRFNTRPWRPDLEKLRQAGVYSCFARNPKEVSAPAFNPPTVAPSRSTWTQTGMNL